MSERALDSDLKAGAESSEYGHVVFVKLAFPSGTVYLHNAAGVLSFGGDDYLGVGTFGAVTTMVEDININDTLLSVELSSIDDGIIAALQTDDVYGKDADIYVGRIDADGQLVGTPTNWVSGFMELANLRLGDDNVVTIKIQTRAGKLTKENNKRYTLEDHQADYPGDQFFEFLHSIQELVINWAGETAFKPEPNSPPRRGPTRTPSIGGGRG